MNKILQIPAAAGAILLAGSIAACAQPGARPTPDPTPVKTGAKAPLIQPEMPRKGKAQGQAVPVDVEPLPWNSSLGDIYEFRTVVDEVTRYCLVFVSGSKGGLHCFDSSEVP